MASIVFTVLGIAGLLYGATVLATESGTGFFLVWIALGALCIGCAVAAHAGWTARIPLAVRRAGMVAGGAGLAALVALTCLVASGFNANGEPDLDYLVVLGAQVREDGPSTVLRHRLDTARDYLERNPETVCIVSGGQGPNEPWTEARGMKEYLVEHGIGADRIVEEGTSTSTVQNIANSMALMDGPSQARVGIVTNDFHVFRSTRIARRLGLDHACGIAAPSDAWFVPNNVLRECLGLVKDFAAGNL